MPKTGGRKKDDVIGHPYAITYALALLLALSILALVAVTLNCNSKTILIDATTGEVVSES